MFFDSLYHTTVNGNYPGFGCVSSFSFLDELIRSKKLRGACAVGLPGYGGYTHQDFIQASKVNTEIVLNLGCNAETRE